MISYYARIGTYFACLNFEMKVARDTLFRKIIIIIIVKRLYAIWKFMKRVSLNYYYIIQLIFLKILILFDN